MSRFSGFMFCIVLVVMAGSLLAITASDLIKSSTTPSPKQKDYILHSITADGTEFYLYMDEEEYQQWASKNYIKIQKLRLEEE
mgnify:FL=1